MARTRDRVFVTGASGFVGACLARRSSPTGTKSTCSCAAEARPWRLAGLAGPSVSARRRPARRRGRAGGRRPRAGPTSSYHLAAHGRLPVAAATGRPSWPPTCSAPPTCSTPWTELRLPGAWSTPAARRSTATRTGRCASDDRLEPRTRLRRGQGGGHAALPGRGVPAAGR